jgi:transcriptional coactivator p15 (PC4)
MAKPLIDAQHNSWASMDSEGKYGAEGGARPRPTLSQPVVVSEWWRNRSGQSIRISLSTYQGKNLINVRTWTTVDGKLKPTVKGFAAELKHLPRLASALAKACSQARELGLITTDDDGEAP